MRVLLIIFFVFFNLITGFSQVIDWEVAWGEVYRDEINTIEKHKTEPYYIAAGLIDKDTLYYPNSLVIIKIDETGDTLFVNDNNGMLRGQATDIVIKPNGNILIFGSGAYPIKTFLLETDTNGNILWIKDYNANLAAKNIGIKYFPNTGNTLMTGTRGYSVYIDFYAIMVNDTGSVVWNTSYFHNGIEIPYHLTTLNDGSFMMSGTSHIGTTKDIYYVNFDLQGNLIRKGNIYTGYYEGFYLSGAINQTQDGGFIITAGNQTGGYPYDTYLFKTDSNFIVEWQFTKPDKGAGPGQEMQDGNFIFAGASSNGPSYLLKLDSAGNVLSDFVVMPQNVIGPTNIADVAFDGIGGALFAGSYDNWYNWANGGEFYFVKVSDLGIPVVGNGCVNAPTIEWVNATWQDSITLTDSSVSNLQYDSYLEHYWLLQDSTTYTGSPFLFDFSQIAYPDSFWAMHIVIDALGCADTMVINVYNNQVLDWPPVFPPIDSTLSILESENNIKVFPNPFNESVRIVINNKLPFILRRKDFLIIDLQGKKVSNLDVKIAKNEALINTKVLAKGVYFLELTINGEKFRNKLVKE